MSASETAGRDQEGDIVAWRNLLWDSVRMLHVGRPDLARRFRIAAGEVEKRLKAGCHPPAHATWRHTVSTLSGKQRD